MLKCNSVHLRSTLSITVAYSLRISVRLDNIGYLVAEPYTVCCLLEKGAKTVTHLQAAEKLSVNASIPQGECEHPSNSALKPRWPHILCSDCPLSMTESLQIPKSSLTPSPSMAGSRAEAAPICD